MTLEEKIATMSPEERKKFEDAVFDAIMDPELDDCYFFPEGVIPPEDEFDVILPFDCEEDEDDID